MASTRTTLTLDGSIQQVIYRQAWQNPARKMQILVIFPVAAITGVSFPRESYEIWLGRGPSLGSATSFTGMSHTAYRKFWSPLGTMQAPLSTGAGLDYSDAVFVRGIGTLIGRAFNFDYVDTVP